MLERVARLPVGVGAEFDFGTDWFLDIAKPRFMTMLPGNGCLAGLLQVPPDGPFCRVRSETFEDGWLDSGGSYLNRLKGV